ncbi:MAG TPA: hypothetical protein VFU72_08980, partial [Nitrolancea sp.]|nr:hypothetical protein [Nitrolancea sp.]
AGGAAGLVASGTGVVTAAAVASGFGVGIAVAIATVAAVEAGAEAAVAGLWGAAPETAVAVLTRPAALVAAFSGFVLQPASASAAIKSRSIRTLSACPPPSQ